MLSSAKPAVPVLWPSWLSPRRIALGAIVLLFVDAMLGRLLTPAGLSRAAIDLPQLSAPDSLRAFAYMAVPATVLGLVCVRAALHGRSAVGAVLGCLASGLVFGFATFAGGYAWMMSIAPHDFGGAGFDRVMMTMGLPSPVIGFTLSVLGLALPVSRSYRSPSCDAVHEALIVAGAWLLAAGTLVFWRWFGMGGAAETRLAPSTWSLPCVLAGLTMLVTGILADHRLLVWLGAVRRGEEPGWRIEPLADRDVQVPALLRSRAPPLMGLLVLDRTPGPLPVARVFLEGSDRRRLLGSRLGAATVAVLLLVAIVPVLLGLMRYSMMP